MKKSYADVDPLEELREIRRGIMRRFKTVEAYGDYLMKAYPVTSPVNPPAEPQPEPPPKGRRTLAKPKANVRSAMRNRKTAAHT